MASSMFSIFAGAAETFPKLMYASAVYNLLVKFQENIERIPTDVNRSPVKLPLLSADWTALEKKSTAGCK